MQRELFEQNKYKINFVKYTWQVLNTLQNRLKSYQKTFQIQISFKRICYISIF